MKQQQQQSSSSNNTGEECSSGGGGGGVIPTTATATGVLGGDNIASVMTPGVTPTCTVLESPRKALNDKKDYR